VECSKHPFAKRERETGTMKGGSMAPERSTEINGHLIEEYYWNGKMVVYVDHYRSNDTYEQACERFGHD